MLTISRLAEYVGVTVRAVRHYHRLGLLPEPERDSSGYRRYGGQAVVDLMKIRTLADAGVPLSRVQEILDAQPDDARSAIDDVDRELGRQIHELQQTRRRLRELRDGEDLVLRPEVVAYLDKIRELGLSERMIDLERDGWLLMQVLYPELVETGLPLTLAHLDDPEYVALYRLTDEAFDWDPEDPRMCEIAVRNVDFIVNQGFMEANETPANDDPAAYGLVRTFNVDSSPAWLRLVDLVEQELDRRGITPP